MQEDGTVYYTNENLSIGDCLRKLYSLEELEEQIGISLIDYFGLIGKDIYVITDESYREYLEYHNNNIDNFFEEDLLDYPKCETITFLHNNEIVYTYYEDYYCYPIAEIGLSWFLTYEEALRKIEELQDIQEKKHNIEVMLQKDRKKYEK